MLRSSFVVYYMPVYLLLLLPIFLLFSGSP